MITLIVNGEKKQIDGPVNLPDFLKGLGVREQFMAVAYNGEVLRREEHDSIILKDGDMLELVRPVGGG